MDKLKYFIYAKKEIILLVFSIFIFILLSLFFLNHYRYQINPDAIYDISIAAKYSKGLFFDAINGYRSPLISIVLVPFIWLKMEPLLAYKIINIICGIIILFIIKKTCKLFLINNLGKFFILIFSIPILLYFIFKETTPDILSAIFILLFFNVLVDKSIAYSYKKGLYLGIITGFGYLSKAYNLIFFISILILVTIVELLLGKQNRKQIIRNLIFAILIILVISLPYIVTLSIKYNEFSYSTIGEFTYKLYSPDYIDNSSKVINHLSDVGLGNNFIVDDNSYLIDKMEFWLDIKFLFKRILLNFYAFFRDVDRIFLVAFSLIYLIFKKTKEYFANFKVYSFFILYVLGYSPLNYVDRFFCSLYILGFIVAVYLFSNFSIEKKNSNKLAIVLILLIISISFVKYPINYLKSNMNSKIGYDSYLRANKISELNLEGRIATNAGSGRDVMYITYYNRDNLQYLGSSDNIEEIKDFSLDYYFCEKKNEKQINSLLSEGFEILYEVDQYYIFKIK